MLGALGTLLGRGIPLLSAADTAYHAPQVLHDASLPYSGMTINQRLYAKRGGRSMAETLRDSFNADRAAQGVPQMEGKPDILEEASKKVFHSMSNPKDYTGGFKEAPYQQWPAMPQTPAAPPLPAPINVPSLPQPAAPGPAPQWLNTATESAQGSDPEMGASSISMPQQQPQQDFIQKLVQQLFGHPVGAPDVHGRMV